MAIAAVPDYSSLVQDYTIEPQGSGGNNVPTSFLLNATLPLRIDGVGTVDMSTSSRTWSTNTFGTAASGIVPASGGGTTNFLRADGTWASPAGSGGYTTIQEEGVDLTQRGKLNFIGPDILAADNAGASRTDVTLTRFTSLVGGTVQASGGGTTNFLRADGTWATPGVPGGITLQAFTPGSTESGHGHISGTFMADTRLVAGPIVTPVAAATIEGYSDSTYTMLGRSAGVGGPGVVLQRARGTLAAPTPTQDADTLGALLASGYSTSGGWAGSIGAGITIRADGNAASNRQPSLTDIIGGDLSSFSLVRMTGAGVRLESGLGAISNPVRPTSTLDVIGSIAFKTTPKSSNFTANASSTHYLLDCTSGQVEGTLPAATSCLNRIYGFTKVDDSFHAGAVISSVTDTINSVEGLFLPSYGDSLWVQSDGTNWWVIHQNYALMQMASRADLAAVGQSTTAEVVAATVTLYNVIAVGCTFGLRVRGTYHTGGTPDLTLLIEETGSGNNMCAWSSFTTPAAAADYVFQIDAEWTVRTSVAGVGTAGILRSSLSWANASGVFTTLGGTSLTAGAFSSAGILPLRVTAQFSTNSASNNVTIRNISGWVTPWTNKVS